MWWHTVAQPIAMTEKGCVLSARALKKKLYWPFQYWGLQMLSVFINFRQQQQKIKLEALPVCTVSFASAWRFKERRLSGLADTSESIETDFLEFKKNYYWLQAKKKKKKQWVLPASPDSFAGKKVWSILADTPWSIESAFIAYFCIFVMW